MPADETVGTPPEQPTSSGSPAFTPEQQAWLNTQFGSARKEGRTTARTELLKELGAESLEDVKRRLEEHGRAADASKTETQRLQDALESERKKAQDALTAAKSAQDALTNQTIRSQVQVIALQGIKMGEDVRRFRNAQDALAFIDIASLTVDEHGNVSGVGEALAALAKERDYLLVPLESASASTPTPVKAPLSPQSPKANTNSIDVPDTDHAITVANVRSWW